MNNFSIQNSLEPIVIEKIPQSGKIKIVSNSFIEPYEHVIFNWKKTNFLKNIKNDETKGWLLLTMRCIDMIGKNIFSLDDIYKFEVFLRNSYPSNYHIKEKLRQQLQILRNKGYLRFLGNGVYELIQSK